MGAVVERKLPDIEVLAQWVQEGLTQRQIKLKIEATGVTVSRSSIACALSRAGLTNGVRYTDTIPWRIAAVHNATWPARMLRLLARRKRGLPLRPQDGKALDAFLAGLTTRGEVVDYDRAAGFMFVAAGTDTVIRGDSQEG